MVSIHKMVYDYQIVEMGLSGLLILHSVGSLHNKVTGGRNITTLPSPPLLPHPGDNIMVGDHSAMGG